MATSTGAKSRTNACAQWASSLLIGPHIVFSEKPSANEQLQLVGANGDGRPKVLVMLIGALEAETFCRH